MRPCERLDRFVPPKSEERRDFCCALLRRPERWLCRRYFATYPYSAPPVFKTPCMPSEVAMLPFWLR